MFNLHTSKLQPSVKLLLLILVTGAMTSLALPARAYCAFGSLEVPLPGFTVKNLDGTDRGMTICEIVDQYKNAADEAGALRAYASVLANLFIVLIIVVGLVMIVVGGYVYMTAGGDASQVGTAKTIVTSALLGILLALSTFIILRTVNPEILGPPESTTIIPVSTSP